MLFLKTNAGPGSRLNGHTGLSALVLAEHAHSTESLALWSVGVAAGPGLVSLEAWPFLWHQGVRQAPSRLSVSRPHVVGGTRSPEGQGWPHPSNPSDCQG